MRLWRDLLVCGGLWVLLTGCFLRKEQSSEPAELFSEAPDPFADLAETSPATESLNPPPLQKQPPATEYGSFEEPVGAEIETAANERIAAPASRGAEYVSDGLESRQFEELEPPPRRTPSREIPTARMEESPPPIVGAPVPPANSMETSERTEGLLRPPRREGGWQDSVSQAGESSDSFGTGDEITVRPPPSRVTITPPAPEPSSGWAERTDGTRESSPTIDAMTLDLKAEPPVTLEPGRMPSFQGDTGSDFSNQPVFRSVGPSFSDSLEEEVDPLEPPSRNEVSPPIPRPIRLPSQGTGLDSTPRSSGYSSEEQFADTADSVIGTTRRNLYNTESNDTYPSQEAIGTGDFEPPRMARESMAPARDRLSVDRFGSPPPDRSDNRSGAGSSRDESVLVATGPDRYRSDNTSFSRRPPTESEPVPDAKTLEERALSLYRSRQFDDAIQDFRKYLSHYPDESQKIQWLLAQALYERGNWAEASQEFRKLVGSPNPENRADALLKLGMIDEKKGDWESARMRWNRVIKTYPQTKAAGRAKSFLAADPPHSPN